MNKKLFRIVLFLCIVATVVTCFFRFVIPRDSKVVTIITSSTLTKAIDIAELSTAEFKYTGIADVYTDESRTNIRCRICYSAVVKAGIDMNAVRFDIDDENKVVTAILPEIGIKVNIIDEKEMAFLPSNVDIGIEDALKYSKEDAEKEALESVELKTVAREYLEATLRGLLLPILKPQGYSLVFR